MGLKEHHSSVRTEWCSYFYSDLTNNKMNVSNAKRKEPKDIKSLKSNFFISTTSIPKGISAVHPVHDCLENIIAKIPCNCKAFSLSCYVPVVRIKKFAFYHLPYYNHRNILPSFLILHS